MTLTFDAERHAYAWNGKTVPSSVTQILDEISNFSHVPEDRMRYARELGTATHEATQFHDQGTLNEGSVDPVIAPRLAAYRKFLADYHPEILMIEQRVYHPLYDYAGTLDRGMLLRRRRAIVDIKTPEDPRLEIAGPQTAAYKEALNAFLRSTLADETYERRYVLQLFGDATYKLTECTDAADLTVFLSCMNIRNWREKHGIKR